MIIFKDISDSDGRYFFMNSPVLPKNKENDHFIKVTNIIRHWIMCKKHGKVEKTSYRN